MQGPRLAIVQINVTDLSRAWDFYVGTLGFEPAGEFVPDRPFRLIVQGAPSIVVYPVDQHQPSTYPHGTGVVLVFAADDLRAAAHDLQSRGVDLVPVPGGTGPFGIAESPVGDYLAFRDPFGNVHELLRPR